MEFDWDAGELKGTNMQPQPMKIWEGIEVIGCTRGSGRRNCDVVQGITYEVTAISNEDITLHMTEDFRRKESTAPREAGNDDAASNDGYDDVGVIDVFNAK